jgi:chemotaxis protein histidine kinase CheA
MPDDVKTIIENPRALPGGNKPPIAETLREACDDLPQRIPVEFDRIKVRTAELMAAFGRVPDVITAENAGAVSDQIAQIAAHVKDADALRVAAVAPVLAAQRALNGWFDKECFDQLDVPKGTPGAKQKLLLRLTAHEQRVAAEEKRRREEVERKAREAQAEAERLAAAEASRLAESEAQARRDASAAAEAIKNEQDLTKALELEALEKERAAVREAQAKAAAEEAALLKAEAEKAAAAASAKASTMATVRGDFGSSSSLRTTWQARFARVEAVDLNALRNFIGTDVIEKAANAYAKVNKNTKPVAGVEFYEHTQAVVRG